MTDLLRRADLEVRLASTAASASTGEVKVNVDCEAAAAVSGEGLQSGHKVVPHWHCTAPEKGNTYLGQNRNELHRVTNKPSNTTGTGVLPSQKKNVQ